MVPVHDVLPHALARLLQRAPLTPAKVDFAWEHAAGAVVARATGVILIDGVLTVRVKDAAWQREIERAIPVLTSRLRIVLGHETLRRIEVRHVPA
jgi:hypothetical protein